eukprot:15710805-Heterocapsa_arctica.AAC.1
MAKSIIYVEDLSTDEGSCNSSDLELEFNFKANRLCAIIYDKVITIKVNNCSTKEDALRSMLKKYLLHVEQRHIHTSDSIHKLNNDDERMAKLREFKAVWFQNNKCRIQAKQNIKDTNNEQYREQIKVQFLFLNG